MEIKLNKQWLELELLKLILKPKSFVYTVCNQIVTVRESGLASLQGLPAKSQTMGGDGLCHWYITEVNHRPLSLFFKDKEVGGQSRKIYFSVRCSSVINL